jgi:hypothetical protein
VESAKVCTHKTRRPLSPRKRTFRAAVRMSALGQKPTRAIVTATPARGQELIKARSQRYAGPVARGIADDDEGVLTGFAGANCRPAQLGFAGACVAPSGIPTHGSFSAHQICMLGASQVAS